MYVLDEIRCQYVPQEAPEGMVKSSFRLKSSLLWAWG